MPTSTTPEPWWTNWNKYAYANPDVFGPLVGGHTVQEAFYHTLQTWLPTYIAEFNRVLGGDILTNPTEYRVRPENRVLSPRTEATVLVVCDGTTGTPQRHAGKTRAVWNVQASVCVSGPLDWQETQALTFAYGAAVRAAIAQHEDLDGVAESSMWTGEKYLEKEHLANRTISLIVVEFNVTTSATIDVNAGPPSPDYTGEGSVSDPSILPYPDAPAVTGAKVDLIKEPIA